MLIALQPAVHFPQTVIEPFSDLALQPNEC
jgi:hypothetical protein